MRKINWKPMIGLLTALTLCLSCASVGMAERIPSASGDSPLFNDVSGHWASDYIQQAYELNLMSGVGNGLFAPDDTCVRAEIVQTLYALAGKPDVVGRASYMDLKEDWYLDAVCWAENHQVTAGVGENKFGPSEPVTREQLAVFLYAYAGYSRTLPETDEDLSEFPDGGEVSSWAIEAMEWAVSNHIISGRAEADGAVYLAPGAESTRAELAVMLVNFHALLEQLHEAENGTLVVNDEDRTTCKLTEEEQDAFRELMESTEWEDIDFVELIPFFTLYLDGTHYLFSTEEDNWDSFSDRAPAFNGYCYITADGLGTYGGRMTEDSEAIEQIFNLLCDVYAAAKEQA